MAKTRLSYRYYVGLLVKGNTLQVFRASSTPTQTSHGSKYRYSIGPFRTKAGAEVMARYGRGNPHLQTVAEAEKMAKRIKELGQLRGGK